MITVERDKTETGEPVYRAIDGNKFAVGKTVGSAFDALAGEQSRGVFQPEGTFVWIPRYEADQFFPAEQRDRLRLLMDEWRAARDSSTPFPEAKQSELEALVDAELDAMAQRAQAYLDSRE